MAIQVKRAYDPPEPTDGFRVLIDRIWPRGRRKEDLKLDEWQKDLGPSTELRQWFGHDPEKWEEFRRRYFQELDAHPEEIQKLREKVREGRLTIVFGSKEERFNNAVALKEYLEQSRPASRPTRARRAGATRHTTAARDSPGRRSRPARVARVDRGIRTSALR